MVFRLKKRSNHTTTKRNQLLFEQLELRQLMSATPALSPPPLELVATPPLEEAEIAAPLTSNWAPMVYAGGDLTTSLGNDVMLNGETLVNLARSLTVTWSLVSGPGTVVFSEPSDTSTTASFSTAGTYELALTVVNDGITVSDELTITVTSNVPAGLVGSWDFEEGNGSTTADVSGSGHSGIVGGAEWTTTGKVGNALRFDGSNDFVDTGKWDVDSDQLTIATWFKADDFGVSDARLLSKTTGVAEQDHYWMLSTIESNGPKLRFRLKADGTTNTLIAGDGILQAGEWMHAAAVYDGAMMRLYLNGTEVGATPHSGQVSVNANVPVSIGNNPDGTKPFDGLIDQMQVYDRALTPEEIAAIIAQASVSNQAPAVDAGVDSSVVVSAALALDGTVSDDGLPNPPATVTTTWSTVSGPGTVTFGDTSAIDTTVSFSQTGDYVLRLAANDGEFTATDEVTITVEYPTNSAPTVDAGADRTVILPEEITLYANVVDDGLPTSSSVELSALAYQLDQELGLEYMGSFFDNWGDLGEKWLLGDNSSLFFVTYDGSFYHWNGDADLSDSEQIATFNASYYANPELIFNAQNPINIGQPAGPLTIAWSTVSGPGDVTFGNSETVDTTVSFNQTGDYVLRLEAYDGEFTSSDNVTITVEYPPNIAPAVDAGADGSVVVSAALALNGTVTDDGLPNPPATVTTTWSTVSGPGAVTFGDTSAIDTTASFSQTGNYVLRLEANDGEFTTSDDVTITVEYPPNIAPAVDAGADGSVVVSAALALNGTVTDDGLPNPPATVTTTWSTVSGPGAVTFGDTSAIDTTASFSQTGNYVLRLEANDGEFTTSDDVTITVEYPPNIAPAVDAGADGSVVVSAALALNGTVTDDGLPNPPATVTTTWSTVSGPGAVTFGDTSAIDTTASFSQAGNYVLRLDANDGEFTTSDDVTITVTSNVSTGLVGSWDFEEGNGSTTADVSGSGNDGVLNGAEWTTTGKVGNALRFDGSNDFVDTGKWDVDSDQLTIATWFKADDFGVSDARLLSKTTGVQEQDHYWMLSTINSNGSKLRFRLKADGTTKTLIAGAGDLVAGEWMHAAAVYDGAMMRLYLNGTEVGATPHSGQVSVNANVPVSIGNNPDGTKPFDGLIDQVQVYDRALTPEEIAAIIAQASVSNQAPAVDAGVDSSVVVSAALALDGTVTDDGLPNPAATVTTTWSQLSGPGAVTFGDTSAIDTTASFTQIGTYVLQLAANDGELVASDTVTVTVTETVGSGELLAFPGAEGFGAQSVGGRGGAVIEVTNLNDSGPGSLRAAIDAEGPRIVVFRVSGIIDLNSELRIRNPYITIAGQTAPGGGITLRNASNVYDAIDIGTNDVIIRYISARPGPSGGTSDAIFFGTGASNVIVDHVSASWASDEVMSLWYDANNITIQWSIISEGIGQQHGLFLGGTESYNVSVHHNLIAQNNERNPRIASNGPVDVVNNVIYNPGNSIWGPSHIYYPELSPKVNYVGNYYKVGPNTGTDPNSTYGYLVSAGGPDSGPIQIFVEGNITPLRPVNGSDETTGVVRPSNLGSVVSSRIDTPLVTTTDAFTARDVVLAGAGANKGLDNNGNAFSRRDAVDARVVDDVINASGTIINNPSEVGGWPVLAPGTPVTDTDRDGMPDAWEVFYGFDLNNPSDGPQDADGDGYTNIEEYLNQTLPAANLTAAVGSAPATSDAKALNPESLSPIIEHAISEWAATGLSDKQIEVLNQVQFRVADLQGPLLAQAGPFAITIDTDAAGHGWFIDSTPEFDEEFNRQGNDLIAESGPAAQRMDLLTVVMHELGHVLGRNHEDAIDLMAETLETDVRRGLATDVLDAVFANHLF